MEAKQIMRKILEIVGIVVVCVLLIALIVVVVLGYRLNWSWVGVSGGNSTVTTITTATEQPPAKTLWDWLQLLIVPVALAIGGFLFTIAQRNAEKDKEKRDALYDLHRRFYTNVYQAYHDTKRVRRLLRATAQYLPPDQRYLPFDQQKTMILLKPYNKQMQALVDIQLRFESFEDDLEQNLLLFPEDQPTDQLRNVLKIYFDILERYLNAIVTEYENHKNLTPASTETALNINDLPELKNFIDQKSKHNKFFKLGRRARKVLLDQLEHEISSLKGVTKPHGKIVCNLSGVDLSGEDLSEANLDRADLRGAFLVSTNLYAANLSGANLTGAILERANLQGAYGITAEELEKQAKSLKGATMPDGSKHP